MLALPQLVHGAAYVDTTLYPTIPLVVDVSGPMPDSVDVVVDGVMTAASQDRGRFVANVAVTLAPGPHALVVTAKTAGSTVATVKGSLVAATGSLEFTTIAMDGLATSGNILHDIAGDALVYTWVSNPTGSKHQLWLNRLDGAFARLLSSDVLLGDPKDEPLNGYTAMGPTGIGVVYRTPKPNDPRWAVKMRVVDPMGKELVPAMDLTNGGATFSVQQAGADPGGFSAAWLHITPPTDPTNPPPVEIRFARWDLAANKLVGPIVLDHDQPQATGSTQGPQALEPLAELGIACNTAICLVSYVRDVYNVPVQLNIPKVFVATIDLASGTMVGMPRPVEVTDWDMQLFGQHLIALADGSFALVYEANDTAAAVNPKSPCDTTLERDLLFSAKLDATGKLLGAPKPIFDNEGPRAYPRLAQHPAGFALFWEDQRSECLAGGHVRMAANVAAPDLKSLLDPYLEMPGSIVLPGGEDPSITVAGTNAVTSWSDNRNGMGLQQIKLEQYLDTYWRK
jgi:hypothetical protein